ncbi:MAG: hypothetical protein JNL32_06555, partial [Candidatus Kapabacteria bacterium]|nr:hypothetical protein [Candidatus Kapabacteria bacterium]
MKYSAIILCLIVATINRGSAQTMVPLRANDITLSTALITSAKELPAGVRFVSTSLVEPSKGNPKDVRKTLSIVYHRATNSTYEVVVNTSAKTIESIKKIDGVQPMVMLDEYTMLDSIVRAYPAWQNAMRKRSINNLDDVIVDSWSAGAVRILGNESARLLRGVSYLRGKQVNFYGRPIEGVSVIVNMNTKRVVEFSDDGIVTMPPPSMELDRASNPLQRPVLNPQKKPLSKPDFTVSDAQEVSWQNWRFRFSMHPREGLVLHSVSYNDKGRQRPILHRMALSEMVVPYGDTSKNRIWRNAFDVVVYGKGMLTYPMDTTDDVPHGAR